MKKKLIASVVVVMMMNPQMASAGIIKKVVVGSILVAGVAGAIGHAYNKKHPDIHENPPAVSQNQAEVPTQSPYEPGSAEALGNNYKNMTTEQRQAYIETLGDTTDKIRDVVNDITGNEKPEMIEKLEKVKERLEKIKSGVEGVVEIGNDLKGIGESYNEILKAPYSVAKYGDLDYQDKINGANKYADASDVDYAKKAIQSQMHLFTSAGNTGYYITKTVADVLKEAGETITGPAGQVVLDSVADYGKSMEPKSLSNPADRVESKSPTSKPVEVIHQPAPGTKRLEDLQKQSEENQIKIPQKHQEEMVVPSGNM